MPGSTQKKRARDDVGAGRSGYKTGCSLDLTRALISHRDSRAPVVGPSAVRVWVRLRPGRRLSRLAETISCGGLLKVLLRCRALLVLLLCWCYSVVEFRGVEIAPGIGRPKLKKSV